MSARPLPDSRKSGARLAIFVGAIIVLLLIGTTLARTSRRPPETTDSRSAASNATGTSSAIGVPAVEAPPPLPPEPAAASSAPIAEGRKALPRSPAKKGPKTDCSFPYIIDQAGIQHIRRECLK
jgi:hypothetical protein